MSVHFGPVVMSDAGATLRPVFDPVLRLFSVHLMKGCEPAGIHGLPGFDHPDDAVEDIDPFLAEHGVRSLSDQEFAQLCGGLIEAKGGPDFQHLLMAMRENGVSAAEVTQPAVHLFTVDGSSYGPYVALTTTPWWSPLDAFLFTRETVRQIVEDLHRDGCGLTAQWNGDDLTFTWDATYMDDPGTETISPDQHGRYAIGGMWQWDEWDGALQPTAEQEAFALGAREYDSAPSTGQLGNLATHYQRGRDEARRVLLMDINQAD
ncbi:hypothetical protein [Streptomyces syringium]|uniref:hypothetical protein n=1 Tax=Streptomyces syringium TaxID=76729 RepID=UPI003AAAAEBF